MKRDPALVPLSREHNAALVLALRIGREVPSADEAGVLAVYQTLVGFWARGLLPHFRAEGECLLARLVRHVPLDDELVRRTHSDHLGIEALVVSMRDNPKAESRRRLLLEFAERIRTHVRWEEETLFEATQQMLTSEEMSALGFEIAERVGEGLTRVDPPAPGA
jgi:hypothetical protein